MRVGDLNGDDLKLHLLRLAELIKPFAKAEFSPNDYADGREVTLEYSSGEIEMFDVTAHHELICKALSALPYLLECALNPSSPSLEAIRTAQHQ